MNPLRWHRITGPGLRALLIGLTSVIIFSLSFFTVNAQSQTGGTSVTVGVGDTALLVTGSTSPGAIVTFKDGSSVVGTATAGSDGRFSQTFPAQSPGIHNLSIYGRDIQNRLTDTVIISVNLTEHLTTSIDVFLPPTFAIAQSTVQQGQSLQLEGRSLPSSTVSFIVDDNLVFTTMTNSDGAWSYQLDTAGIDVGNHSIFARARDNSGNQSYPTSKQNFTIQAAESSDQTQPPPPAPVITSPTDGAVIDGTSVIIKGTALPGTQIIIYDAGRQIGSVFANSRGEWQFELTLTADSYDIFARACRATICSGSSNRIRIYRKTPGSGQPFNIKLEEYSYVIEEGQSVALKLSAENSAWPIKLEFDWQYGPKETQVLSQEKATYSHHYPKSGRYNGTISATNAAGATQKVFFSVRVLPIDQSRPLPWFIFLLLLMLLCLIYFISRKHRKLKKN